MTGALALGSAFKLWVLLALDEKLQRGDGHWEDELVVRDASKSIPSGELQDKADGTRVSVRDAASKMISISDNTATDLADPLCRPRGGRGRAGAVDAQRASAQRAVDDDRELSLLKWDDAEALRDAYRAADVAGKSKILDGLAARPLGALDTLIKGWRAPRAIDIEWFASTLDLCNVMATLGARGGFDAQSDLLRLLGINPGVGLSATDWKYVGYKGGSRAGCPQPHVAATARGPALVRRSDHAERLHQADR